METLNITDLSKLEFIEIKPWLIKFTYDNIHYYLKFSNFLHDKKTNKFIGTDTTIKLFKQEQYANIEIKQCTTDDLPNMLFLEKIDFNHNNRAKLDLKTINKEYFVRKLTMNGIVDSMYSSEIIGFYKQISLINNQIEKLYKEIDALKYQKDKMTQNFMNIKKCE